MIPFYHNSTISIVPWGPKNMSIFSRLHNKRTRLNTDPMLSVKLVP